MKCEKSRYIFLNFLDTCNSSATYLKHIFVADILCWQRGYLRWISCRKTNHSYFLFPKSTILFISDLILPLYQNIFYLPFLRERADQQKKILFTGSTQNTHTRVVFWTMMQRNSAVLKERKCVFALWWIVVTFVPCAIYCLYSNCRFVVNIFGYRYG